MTPESVGNPKIFCIGLNKTGTTSLERALQGLGFKTAQACHLLDDWAKRDFRRLVQLCQTADAFQDIPFSLPFTYQILDYAFPHSRFILTVRHSADEWYRSLTTFHTNLIGRGRLPTADDLKQSPILYDGWLWRTLALVGGVDESAPYDRERWIRLYEDHNASVASYFRYRPESLLVVNLSESAAMNRLCAFLGVASHGMTMPHITSDDIVQEVRHDLNLGLQRPESPERPPGE